MDEDPTSTLSFLYGTLSRPQNNSDRYEQVHFVDVKNKAKKKKKKRKLCWDRVDCTTSMEFGGPEIQLFYSLNFNSLIYKKGLNVCLFALI